jgi:hypothetical protein
VSRNAVDELAALAAVLLRQRADPAAFRAAEPAVLALVTPLARLAVGRALQATLPLLPAAPVAPPEAPLGPVDPAVLEATVLELLRTARGRQGRGPG